MSLGKVYLVGAGPGDADLITRRGLSLIHSADVILYDRLIPLELLDEARPLTELINVGKLPTKHRFSQDAINELLVTHARLGRQVVRLKGGDPFVFGRGGEEALYCHAHGIPFEVVPGVSSAFAVPAYAGIPLTHRHLSRNFTVITGHDDPDDPANATDFEALVRLGGTLVILMGVSQLPALVQKLLVAGMAADTPAAIIEWGTTEHQRVVTASLVTLYHQAELAQIGAPATIVIGEVVNLRAQGVRWFEQGLQNHALDLQESVALGTS